MYYFNVIYIFFLKLVHQGEEGDPVTIIDAITDLGADRIGHGIQAIKSNDVMKYLVEHSIPLEVSVSRFDFFFVFWNSC